MTAQTEAPTSADTYYVSTTAFSGPLELLLELVIKNKLPINEVSLAQIADEFISHIRQKDKIPVNLTSNFIVVAATLLLIKSKEILPTLTLTEEEEADISDLTDRLKSYNEIVRLSHFLKEQYAKNPLFFSPREPEKIILFSPGNFSSLKITGILDSVLKRLPKNDTNTEAHIKKTVSLEEKIKELAVRITKDTHISFSSLTKTIEARGREKRVEIIVTFLALLELVKQETIRVTQEAPTKDIIIRHNIT